MTTSSATGTATQSLVTALGGGSGVDMTMLAANLANAQFAARADRLAAKSETLDKRISAASTLKSMLLSLATSLGTRVRQGDLSPQPLIANGAVARAALSGAGQPGGTYSLEVTALARGQTLASPPYASAGALTGSGTLTLRFGTVAGAAFTEDTARPAVAVTIASGATLSDVAAAINAARAGVTAYVAGTAEGARLVLKGAEGTASGFVLDALETAGDEGLAALAWTPAAAPARLLTGASDAAFTIDGLAMTAKTNTVADAIPGVTLALTGINSGSPTNITFSDPGSAITAAMADLTGALNEIAAELGSATNVKTGELLHDDGARSLRRALGGLAGAAIMPQAGIGSARTLADLGLSTQRDGSFLLDSARLAATLKTDPQGAAAMFTNGLYGIFAAVDGIARTASSASDPGSLSGSISRYTKQKTRLGEEQGKLTEAQETMRARLVSRFAVADTRIGVAKSTLTFLQNQIDAWNGQRG